MTWRATVLTIFPEMFPGPLGASLAGKVVRVTNRGSAVQSLGSGDLAPKDTLAIAIAQPTLEPGASTAVFVVGANGEPVQ